MRPLYQPFVMVSCDDPKTAQLTKATSRPSPDNATFMECVEMDIKLPADRQFAPCLEFYVYDNVQGLPVEVPWMDKPIVAYGSMPVGNFYPNEEEGEENLEPPQEEDDQAKEKRLAKVRRRKFMELTRTLVQKGTLNKRMRNTLERFWDKKDEAVKRAFDQYTTAPDEEKFVERVLEYFNVEGGEGGSVLSTLMEFTGLGGGDAKDTQQSRGKTADGKADGKGGAKGGSAKASGKAETDVGSTSGSKRLPLPASAAGSVKAASTKAASTKAESVAGDAAGDEGDADGGEGNPEVADGMDGDEEAGQAGPDEGDGEDGMGDTEGADRPTDEDDRMPDRQDDVRARACACGVRACVRACVCV